jgi:hypothetical protein
LCGLATATAERVVAGSKAIEVARVRIIEAGQTVLNRALSTTGDDAFVERKNLTLEQAEAAALLPSQRLWPPRPALLSGAAGCPLSVEFGIKLTRGRISITSSGKKDLGMISALAVTKPEIGRLFK